MTRNQAAMQAVDDMEKQEAFASQPFREGNGGSPQPQTAAQVLPGPGHNNPPESMKQDVQAEKVEHARQIHQKNQSLPSAELASQTANLEAENQKLIQRIAVYQSTGESELQTARNEYEIYRGLLEAEMADAVSRRDAFIQTLNEEIASIRERLDAAENEHEVKKGQVIRHNQEQIASMEETIKRNKLWLEG